MLGVRPCGLTLAVQSFVGVPGSRSWRKTWRSASVGGETGPASWLQGTIRLPSAERLPTQDVALACMPSVWRLASTKMPVCVS